MDSQKVITPVKVGSSYSLIPYGNWIEVQTISRLFGND